jgi:hypothetical protein
MKTWVTQQQARTPHAARVWWIATAGLFLAIVILSPPPALAQTVTGGTITINDVDNATFILSGTGPGSGDTFTLTGYTYVPGGNSNLLCWPCSGPLPIFFGASGLDFVAAGNGTTYVSGVTTTYPTIAWSDFNQQGGPTYFFINGAPISLTWSGPWPHSFTSTVTYSLALCGLTNVTGLPHCDVTLPVQSGTAVLDLTIDVDPNTGYLHGIAAKIFF